MRRRQIFVDAAAGVELVLPVTPAGYGWEHGINVEQVNIDRLGDLNLPGYGTLDKRSVECFFPARDYPFNEPGTVLNPWWYLERIERWIDARRSVRYIVSGTPLNALVLIQSVEYREKDGTNDVYAAIALRQYRTPDAPETAAAREVRGADAALAAYGSYVVAEGDTLSAIARRFYGDESKYLALAKANSIANPNLIFPGQVLTIPGLDALPAAAAPTARSARVAGATKFVRTETGQRVMTTLKEEREAGGLGTFFW